MLLIALVVRSTTQKEFAFPHHRQAVWAECLVELPPYSLEMVTVFLHGTDKKLTVAIEGIVAHGPGGNQGELLVF